MSTISSYIPTDGATATRNADVLPFPFPARPQAMTVYVRFVELGTILSPDNTKVLVIGSSGNDSFQVDMDADPTPHYRIGVSSLTQARSAGFGTAPNIGDRVEIVGRLHQSNNLGSVSGIQSINGGAPETAAESATLVLTQAYQDPGLDVNSRGTSNIGFIAIRNIVIIRGVQTLETMRRLAGI